MTVGSSADAVGTKDFDFLRGFIEELVRAGSHGDEVQEDGLNFMLAVVKGIEPRDQVGAMLAAQLAAIHNATMIFADRLAEAENLPQQDSAQRAFNKLARTFLAQMDALKRYRKVSEQTVRVEHVTVNAGGQAVVGNVTHRGRDLRGPSQKAEATS